MSIHQEEESAPASFPSLTTWSSTPPPKVETIDLHACTPDKLALWLLSNRFADDAMGTASLLLECTSSLPDAKGISARLLGVCIDDNNDKDDNEDEEFAREEGAVADVSFLMAAAEPPLSPSSPSESPCIAMIRLIESAPSAAPPSADGVGGRW